MSAEPEHRCGGHDRHSAREASKEVEDASRAPLAAVLLHLGATLDHNGGAGCQVREVTPPQPRPPSCVVPPAPCRRL